MNLNALTVACENRSGFNDPAYRTTWHEFINEAVREYARRQPWAGLEDSEDAVLSANQRYHIFPTYVDEILEITDLTNYGTIDREGDFGKRYPRQFTQGTAGQPVLYDLVGDVPALAGPSGYCYAVSSHVSDTAILYLDGIAANSGASGTALAYSQKRESVTLNGTTPVTLTNLFTQFTSIGKATVTSGDYILYDAGNTNAHISLIPSGELDARFRRIQLMRIPSVNTEIRYRFRHRPPALVTEDQAPHPAVDSDFIIQYAISLFQREQDQYQKAELHERKATNTIRARANKDHNFGEPYSQIIPDTPYGGDVDDDGWRGGW